jgi:hypothetical protein
MVAVLAGLGRAMSEVGAVMIVGGNIDRSTRTMTTAIALETSKGDLPLAVALGLVLLAVILLQRVGLRAAPVGHAPLRLRERMFPPKPMFPLRIHDLHWHAGGGGARRLQPGAGRGGHHHPPGPNGAGKSVFLRSVCGLLQPDAGIDWGGGRARRSV